MAGRKSPRVPASRRPTSPVTPPIRRRRYHEGDTLLPAALAVGSWHRPRRVTRQRLGRDRDRARSAAQRPVSAQGNAVAEGAKIAAEEINDAGGVDGKDIKLVIEDNANDPATCVSVAQRFATKVQPAAVMGGWGSSCTLTMQPALERAKVPLLVETSSSDL